MTEPEVNRPRFSGAARMVRIGGVTKPELRTSLRLAGIRLNTAAEELFADDRFVTSPVGEVVETVAVSVGDLGLGEGAVFSAVVARAVSIGLALCPLELAPHFRLELTDQPEGAVGQPLTLHCAPPGSITVASAPIAEDDETPKGFYLRRIDGVPWLRGYRASPDHSYGPTDVFVFCRTARSV